MKNWIASLQTKLVELSRKDPGHTIFGASKHGYTLRPMLVENEVIKFEQRFGIQLPVDYRSFLLYMGNGGAGPFYGIEKLQDSLYQDLDDKDKTQLTDPAQEFPFTEAWNLEFGDDEDVEDGSYFIERENEYFDSKWSNGLLRVANFGCGVSINLVVKGKEYGHIWVDDRCNDGGIYPDKYFGNENRLTFLQWYELWLDKSISEVPK